MICRSTRTSERVSHLRRFLSSSDLNIATMPANGTPPQQSPPPQQAPTHQQSPTQQQMMLLAQSARSLPVSRFTGYIPEGVPHREQLMSYDVNRWLCDTETRCSVKNITDDALKIREAKVAVASDVGDACIVLNTGRMNEITVYSDFKAKCLKFWRPASERDRYHALSDFLSVDFDRSMGVFAGNLEKARMRILQDLKGDDFFKKGTAAEWDGGDRSTDILVSLEDVVNYFSWGVLFKAVPPTFREALRKVDVKYSDDYVEILSNVQSEMLKLEKNARIEVSAFAGAKKKEFSKASSKSDSNKSQGKAQSLRCFRCEKIGHFSKDCHVKLKCTYCMKEGHVVSKCFQLKRQNKKSHDRSDNSSSSNSQVVDADDKSQNESN